MRFASSAAAFLTAALVPCSAVYAADSTKIGYGQGTTLDEKGRPADAVSFNQRYSDLEAYALTNDDDRIIITFDQGYENGYTEKILDTLKEKNVKAIFFLTGDYAKKETALVQRMIDEGHIVGNHTYHHYDMSKLSDEAAFNQELTSLETLYRETTGEDLPRYYRPPQGIYSEKNLEMAQKLGYRTVFWSLAYVDWYQDDQPTDEQAFAKLLPRIHPGAVVLLHSTSQTNARILDTLLTKWEEMGYTFGTLDELYA